MCDILDAFSGDIIARILLMHGFVMNGKERALKLEKVKLIFNISQIYVREINENDENRDSTFLFS